MSNTATNAAPMYADATTSLAQDQAGDGPNIVQRRRRERTPRRGRTTPLARRRRLYRFMRSLASDLGLGPNMTLPERAALTQAAVLLLQAEVAQDGLVNATGSAIDPDTSIRLASEARRLLASLRRRELTAAKSAALFSPLLQRARRPAAATPQSKTEAQR
jgi:hypothetical protein